MSANKDKESNFWSNGKLTSIDAYSNQKQPLEILLHEGKLETLSSCSLGVLFTLGIVKVSSFATLKVYYIINHSYTYLSSLF